MDDVIGTSAVGTELHGVLHDTGADLLAQTGGHIVGHQGGDNTVLDVVDQGHMDIEQCGGIQGQALDAQLCDLLHDHVQHIVTVTHMVMEGNGHTILQACGNNGITNGCYKLLISHASRSSLRIPSASAAAMVCFARFTMGASIILPRSAMAPLPCSLASAMASRTS